MLREPLARVWKVKAEVEAVKGEIKAAAGLFDLTKLEDDAIRFFQIVEASDLDQKAAPRAFGEKVVASKTNLATPWVRRNQF